MTALREIFREIILPATIAELLAIGFFILMVAVWIAIASTGA